MKTKVCTRCRQEKSLSEFYKAKGGKGGLCSFCKSCNSKKHKKWYEKNKIKANAYRSRCQRSLKQKCVDYKGGKCSICGYDKCVAALDFHHINPKEKEFAFHGLTASWKKAEKELNKCALLCANCHRELHYYSKE